MASKPCRQSHVSCRAWLARQVRTYRTSPPRWRAPGRLHNQKRYPASAGGSCPALRCDSVNRMISCGPGRLRATTTLASQSPASRAARHPPQFSWHMRNPRCGVLMFWRWAGQRPRHRQCQRAPLVPAAPKTPAQCAIGRQRCDAVCMGACRP